MKNEWKPEELRATSEEIRGAVMPKTITPEMVGGTLLGVVNALGEVVEVLGEIPREHVTVKVRGYDGTGAVSGAGATVWLDVFHTNGYPYVSLPRQELTCDENGIVEFDVPHGYRYAVFSQIVGLGASFQLVNVAALEAREMNLWNLPMGIKHLYLAAIYSGIDGEYRGIPKVTDNYVGGIDWDDEEIMAEWGWDSDPEKDEYMDDYYYYGILVSTADTSFVIGISSKSEEKMPWSSNLDFGTVIPGIPAINYDGPETIWVDLLNRARADMDGNMNTAKILDNAHNPPAANYCVEYIGIFDEQRWLPSAGQAYLICLNNTAINALMTEYNTYNGNTDFVLLPVKKTNGAWDKYENFWTSTIFDNYDSFGISWGDLTTNRRYDQHYVRAVSAFHFEY